MVIFDRKTLSNLDENGKFVILSPDLPKTDIKKANVLRYSISRKIEVCYTSRSDYFSTSHVSFLVQDHIGARIEHFFYRSKAVL